MANAEALRVVRGWSVTELERRIVAGGYPSWPVGAWQKAKHGRRKCLLVDELWALAGVFRVSPLELVGGVDRDAVGDGR